MNDTDNARPILRKFMYANALMSENHLTNTRFSDLGLKPVLLEGATDAGFEFCTEIQAQTLPLALAGKDVAGQAQTGTGKTAAFLLAIMQELLRADSPDAGGNPRALVLAPTRELAVQIARDAQVLGAHSGLRIQVVYGGEGYESQREGLREGVDLLIGTPGRLIDYFKQHIFNLRHIQVVVLDEADRMFDLGFIKDIRFLFHRMPAPGERLNMLFSATMSHRVTELAYEHMNNPEVVNVSPEGKTADRVNQVLYHVSSEEKIPLLIGLMRRMKPQRSLVFVNTKRQSERVEDYFAANGIDAAVISGDVPQRKRMQLLEKFQAGQLSVLVATDVAARGLHIEDVSHVFNFDLPQDAEDYVHRIGRTARAGASGDAVSLACETYVYSLPEIEDYIGAKIPVAAITEDLVVEPVRPPRRPPRKRPGGPGRHGGGRSGPGGGRPGGGARGRRGGPSGGSPGTGSTPE